jgi:hypothetical protein
MRKILSVCFLALALPAYAFAEEVGLSVRDRRCHDMRNRFEAAQRRNPFGITDEIARLRNVAIDLCAHGKQAQGSRAFASAAELLEK